MATTKVVDVLDRASIILQDTTHVRFPNEELLKFFNDAQKEVVLHRPDAKMVNENLALVDGSKQTLPATGLRLIDVVRNVNGRSVTQVDRKILDETLPNWHESTAGTNKIEHFIYDPADPKNFYVYPKGASGTHSLEVIYSTAPSDVAISNFTTDTTVIGVDDVYANALLDYILYRAYQKDSEFAGNVSRAQMHYQSFATSLGVKTQADGATTPVPKNPDMNAGRV
tara:strand:+ start:3533 stop:4210 length:678 start_codon:yes stop_codon:yes gene_type:complete